MLLGPGRESSRRCGRLDNPRGGSGAVRGSPGAGPCRTGCVLRRALCWLVGRTAVGVVGGGPRVGSSRRATADHRDAYTVGRRDMTNPRLRMAYSRHGLADASSADDAYAPLPTRSSSPCRTRRWSRSSDTPAAMASACVTQPRPAARSSMTSSGRSCAGMTASVSAYAEAPREPASRLWITRPRPGLRALPPRLRGDSRLMARR